MLLYHTFLISRINYINFIFFSTKRKNKLNEMADTWPRYLLEWSLKKEVDDINAKIAAVQRLRPSALRTQKEMELIEEARRLNVEMERRAGLTEDEARRERARDYMLAMMAKSREKKKRDLKWRKDRRAGLLADLRQRLAENRATAATSTKPRSTPTEGTSPIPRPSIETWKSQGRKVKSRLWIPHL